MVAAHGTGIVANVIGHASMGSERENVLPAGGDAGISVADAMASASDEFTTKVASLLCLANACDAMETMSFGFVVPQLGDDFVGLETIAAAVFIGMLLGGVVSGHIANEVGKQALLVGMLRLETVAGVCGAMVSTGPSFAFWRGLSGFAIGAAVPPLFNLAEELLEPEGRRHRWLTLVAASFIVGSAIDAVLAWVLIGLLGLSWRIFYIAASLVPLINAQLISRCVPEAPSFLLAHGRRVQLQEELRKFKSKAQEPSADLAFRLRCHEATVSFTLSALLSGPWRGSLGKLSIICCNLAFAWYGLSTWLLLIFRDVGVENEYVAALAFALSGVPGVLICLWLIKHVQAYKLLAFFLLLNGFCCVALSAIAASSPAPNQTAAPNDTEHPLERSPVLAAFVVCLFNSVSTAVFNVLVTLWATPYPPDLQALAVGFQSSWMRIGSIAAQLVDGKLVRAHQTGRMALLSAMMLMLASGVSLFLHPRRTQLLPDASSHKTGET